MSAAWTCEGYSYWRHQCLLRGHLWRGTAGYGTRVCLLCGAKA